MKYTLIKILVVVGAFVLVYGIYSVVLWFIWQNAAEAWNENVAWVIVLSLGFLYLTQSLSPTSKNNDD